MPSRATPRLPFTTPAGESKLRTELLKNFCEGVCRLFFSGYTFRFGVTLSARCVVINPLVKVISLDSNLPASAVYLGRLTTFAYPRELAGLIELARPALRKAHFFEVSPLTTNG